MQFSQLDYFIKVCRCKSFSKAARECFISVQGLSSTINRLEKELGRPLFVRTPHGVEMTQDGAYLYEIAEVIMQNIHDCEKHFFDGVDDINPPINVSYITELMSTFRENTIDVFNSKYSVSFRSGGSYSCEEDVADGRSTFAFVNAPPFSSEFEYRYCFTRQRWLVTHKDNPILKKENLRIEDLAGEKFVMVDRNYKTYGEFLDLCKQHGFKPNIVCYTSSASTTNALLRQHHSWIGMSFDFYCEQLAAEGIVALPLEDFEWPWNIYVASKRGDVLSQYQKNFLAELMDSFISDDGK